MNTFGGAFVRLPSVGHGSLALSQSCKYYSGPGTFSLSAANTSSKSCENIAKSDRFLGMGANILIGCSGTR